MPDLQSSDPGRKLALRYSLVGGGIAPFLSPELVPVVVVDDLTQDDVRALEFQRGCMANEVNAGVVARFPRVGLQNPTGSGVLATLEWVYVGGSGSFQLEVSPFIGDNVIADHGAFRDTRIPGAPVCGMFQADVAGSAELDFLIDIVITGNSPNQIFNLPIVFGPGSFVDFRGSVLDTTLTVQAMWKERFLLAGEE